MRVARLERSRGMGRRASSKGRLQIGLSPLGNGLVEIAVSPEDASFYPQHRWSPSDISHDMVTTIRDNGKSDSLRLKMDDRDTMAITEREAVAIAGREFSGHSGYLVYWAEYM